MALILLSCLLQKDDGAIKALTEFYSEEFKRIDKESLDVLDLCSSWISHLPSSVKYGKVVGLGMNEQELAANEALTSYVVQDLNENPSLQFEDDSFDVICNVVSVDYLTQPLDIFREVYRILRPGGVALMSFSNRCFPTKAVAMWLQGLFMCDWLFTLLFMMYILDTPTPFLSHAS